MPKGITLLLGRACRGNSAAKGPVFELVIAELRKAIAALSFYERAFAAADARLASAELHSELVEST
jgi:hypothetical protein